MRDCAFETKWRCESRSATMITFPQVRNWTTLLPCLYFALESLSILFSICVIYLSIQYEFASWARTTWCFHTKPLFTCLQLLAGSTPNCKTLKTLPKHTFRSHCIFHNCMIPLFCGVNIDGYSGSELLWWRHISFWSNHFQRFLFFTNKKIDQRYQTRQTNPLGQRRSVIWRLSWPHPNLSLFFADYYAL